MKMMKMFMLALVCLMMQSAACFADVLPLPDDDKPIAAQQLPAAAKTFIQQYFPKLEVVYAEKDTEFLGTTYEVRLSDGTKLEFDKKGNWDNVNRKTKAVPAALVPKAISSYVAKTYPGQRITKIDKERYGYEVELSNDLDLKFNKKGAFIGVDD